MTNREDDDEETKERIYYQLGIINWYYELKKILKAFGLSGEFEVKSV